MSWVIGLMVAMFGCLCGALGDNMVRKAYLIFGPTVKPSILLRSPYFVIGMFLTTVVDALCTIVALGFAPSSIVTPFAAVHIFLTLLIARLWLKEPMGKWVYLGSFLLILGVVIIVTFAGKTSEFQDLQDFGQYMATTPSRIYLISVSIMIIIFICFSSNFFSSRLPHYNYSIKRFSTAAASGILGGNTNIAAKALTVALSDFFDPVNPSYRYWGTYLVILATSSLAFGQLFFLNLGLKNYPAGFVVPVTNSFLVSTGIVGGIMFLNEIPNAYGTLSLVFVLFGLAIILLGIFVFTWKHSVSQLLTSDQITKIQTLDNLSFRLGSKQDLTSGLEPPHIPSSSSFLSSSSLPAKSIVFSSCALLTIHSFQDQFQASKIVTNLSYISNDSIRPYTNHRLSHILRDNDIELDNLESSSTLTFCYENQEFKAMDHNILNRTL